MSKKYQLITDRVPLPGGGFIDAIRIALVEFSCLGERRFDVSGYPHASEHEALMRDWISISRDMNEAIRKLSAEMAAQGLGALSVQKEPRATEAAAKSVSTAQRSNPDDAGASG